MVKRTLTIVCVALAAVGSAGCAGEPRTAIEQLLESRRLAAELLLQLAKTDRGRQSRGHGRHRRGGHGGRRAMSSGDAAVQRDAAALAALLTRLQYTSESAMLDEFQKRFAEFRDLDREILDLAALDTNLKAQRLSFGPAQEAADAVRDALAAVVAASPHRRWQVRALAAEVMSSVREIQALAGSAHRRSRR